eukprot:1646485-Prymnesium_polylepis.2
MRCAGAREKGRARGCESSVGTRGVNGSVGTRRESAPWRCPNRRSSARILTTRNRLTTMTASAPLSRGSTRSLSSCAS